MVRLGTLGNSTVNSYVQAVSADGNVVVGNANNSRNVYRAICWTQATGM